MKNGFIKSRQKAIITGLYLSKFNEDGLKALGFKGFHEAFNVIGYSITAKPASIKNYRDEFDPYFPNPRKGWHQRSIRDYCERVLQEFSHIEFEAFTELVKGFLIENYELEKFVEKINPKGYNESVAKRLTTGKAAEEFFKQNYQKQPEFIDYSFEETTHLGCGFDFKLNNDSNFYCVEVKGLSEKLGSISLTEKEYEIADQVRDQYCVFIVLNFLEKPFHKAIFNPLYSNLKFKRVERKVVAVNYLSSI